MLDTAEKRRQRTRIKHIALRWFLDHRVEKLGLTALVVSNSEGVLVSHSGQGVDPHWAAAMAPCMFLYDWNFPGPAVEPCMVDAVPMEKSNLFVFALGASDPKAFERSKKK